jgi:glutamate--cysteine ligase
MSAQILTTVPHLLTANTGPFDKIEQQILTNQENIEIWLREQFNETNAPFYGSVDLRVESKI